MKKAAIACMLVLSLALMTFGCAGEGGVITMQDRVFIHQLENLMANIHRYLGYTVRVEGMFYHIDGYHAIVRLAPSCCGEAAMEGLVGFWLELDDMEPLPHDTWVHISGELGLDEYGAVVRVTDMEERPRGQEFVSQ